MDVFLYSSAGSDDAGAWCGDNGSRDKTRCDDGAGWLNYVSVSASISGGGVEYGCAFFL